MRVSIRTGAEFAARKGRTGLLVLLALALAACGAPPVLRTDVPDYGEVKALFVLGEDIQVINIRALDRVAISAAVLVLPDGERVPAYSIDQQRNPTYSNRTPIGALSTDSVIGIGGGVQLLNGPGMNPQTTVLIGQIASTALIRVPDLQGYREVWPKAKLEIHMGFAPDEQVETLAAPQPG